MHRMVRRVVIAGGVIAIAVIAIAVVDASSSGDRSCPSGEDRFAYSLTIEGSAAASRDLEDVIGQALAPAPRGLWSPTDVTGAVADVGAIEAGSTGEVQVGGVIVRIERGAGGAWTPVGGSFCTDVVDGRDLKVTEGTPGQYDR
jgi:hypothetical protein